MSVGTRDDDLEKIIEAHQDRVYRVALSVLGPGHEADAEDLTQEVFIRMINSIDSFRGESSLTTWLHRIAYNAAVESRRRKRHTAPHAPPRENELVTSPEDGSEKRATRQVVERLRDEERLLVHLYYWFGYTTREMSEIVGQPDATIRSKLMRIRRKIATHMEKS